MSAETLIAVEPAFLGKAAAAAFLAVSESTIDNLVSAGELARPRRISKGRTGWLLDDLRAFARSRPESDLLPPPNAGYGRTGKPSA